MEVVCPVVHGRLEHDRGYQPLGDMELERHTKDVVEHHGSRTRKGQKLV